MLIIMVVCLLILLMLVLSFHHSDLKVNKVLDDFYTKLNNSSNKDLFLKTQSKKYLKYIDKDCGHFFVYDSYPAFFRVYKNYYYRNYHLYQSDIDLTKIINKNFNKSIFKYINKIY